MRGREGDLLDLGKVVLNILVEGKLADGPQRNLLLRPDLGQVEDVPAELLGLLGGQDLDIDGPAGIVALLDGLEEVLGVPVGVLGSQLAGLLIRERLVSLVRLEVDLGVHKGAVGLGPLVGVPRVAVHVAVRVGRAAVGEEVHDLVDGLLVSGEVVPEHGGILEVGLRVALLGVDEEGEVGGVSQEEDGRVVVDPVPVALLGVELDGEASRITGGVGRALLATDGREASNALGLLSDLAEHVDGRDVSDIVGHLEFTVSTSTLGVDYSLGDALACGLAVSKLRLCLANLIHSWC